VRKGFLLRGAGVALSLGLLGQGRAYALDKQGSAHAGEIAGPNDGFNVSGALLYGVSLYNPTFASRPDNTGLTLFRYALHADIDLIGRRLSIPLHLNFYTDGSRRGGGIFVPSEGDILTGVTSTWRLGPGALEVGSRLEHDAPLDRGGITQTFIDARARYLYSLAALWPSLGSGLANGDVRGWLTFGGFLYNPSFPARPDNTGRALFRYAARTEISAFNRLIGLGVDATFFTDRRVNPGAPSELDLTPEIVFHKAPFELHLAYERDMPLDRAGLVQEFVYLLGVYEFDFANDTPAEAEDREEIVSP
jgi:hypothetical protein